MLAGSQASWKYWKYLLVPFVTDTTRNNTMPQTSSQWKVHGGHRLSGAVTTNSSKYSTLAILSASLLTMEPIVLTNVPRISDVDDMVSILTYWHRSDHRLLGWTTTLWSYSNLRS
jgi:hypothetical protein